MKAGFVLAGALLAITIFAINSVLNAIVGLFVWYYWPRIAIVALCWYRGLNWLVRGMVFPSCTFMFRRKQELAMQEAMGRELYDLLQSLKSALLTSQS